jgi:hypothetical protein
LLEKIIKNISINACRYKIVVYLCNVNKAKQLKNSTMKATQIIKTAGFTTARINTTTFKGVFGGNCNHVVGLFNSKGEVLLLDGKPYFPAGKKSAFAALIQSGDINASAFGWG